MSSVQVIESSYTQDFQRQLGEAIAETEARGEFLTDIQTHVIPYGGRTSFVAILVFEGGTSVDGELQETEPDYSSLEGLLRAMAQPPTTLIPPSAADETQNSTEQSQVSYVDFNHGFAAGLSAGASAVMTFHPFINRQE